LLSARGKKASIQPNSFIKGKGGISKRGSRSVTETDRKKRKATPSKKIETGVRYLDNQSKDTQRKRVRGKTASESLQQHKQTSRRRRGAQKKRDFSRARLNSTATATIAATATSAATANHVSKRGRQAALSENAREDQKTNTAVAGKGSEGQKTGSQFPKHAKLGAEEGKRRNQNRRKGVRN